MLTTIRRRLPLHGIQNAGTPGNQNLKGSTVGNATLSQRTRKDGAPSPGAQVLFYPPPHTEIQGHVLSSLRDLRCSPAWHPRLAPWAAFFRRSAAGVRPNFWGSSCVGGFLIWIGAKPLRSCIESVSRAAAQRAVVWLITLRGEFGHCNPVWEISILKHLPENQVGIGSALGRARMGRSVL